AQRSLHFCICMQHHLACSLLSVPSPAILWLSPIPCEPATPVGHSTQGSKKLVRRTAGRKDPARPRPVVAGGGDGQRRQAGGAGGGKGAAEQLGAEAPQPVLRRRLPPRAPHLPRRLPAVRRHLPRRCPHHDAASEASGHQVPRSRRRRSRD
uniref:Uncharacterized protein n=1 Tax=Aegilops tauschii subsp. strangulata TaxID=200361 RepID=A0A452XH77_AEGTS